MKLQLGAAITIALSNWCIQGFEVSEYNLLYVLTEKTKTIIENYVSENHRKITENVEKSDFPDIPLHVFKKLKCDITALYHNTLFHQDFCSASKGMLYLIPTPYLSLQTSEDAFYQSIFPQSFFESASLSAVWDRSVFDAFLYRSGILSSKISTIRGLIESIYYEATKRLYLQNVLALEQVIPTSTDIKKLNEARSNACYLLLTHPQSHSPILKWLSSKQSLGISDSFLPIPNTDANDVICKDSESSVGFIEIESNLPASLYTFYLERDTIPHILNSLTQMIHLEGRDILEHFRIALEIISLSLFSFASLANDFSLDYYNTIADINALHRALWLHAEFNESIDQELLLRALERIYLSFEKWHEPSLNNVELRPKHIILHSQYQDTLKNFATLLINMNSDEVAFITAVSELAINASKFISSYGGVSLASLQDKNAFKSVIAAQIDESDKAETIMRIPVEGQKKSVSDDNTLFVSLIKNWNEEYERSNIFAFPEEKRLANTYLLSTDIEYLQSLQLLGLRNLATVAKLAYPKSFTNILKHLDLSNKSVGTFAETKKQKEFSLRKQSVRKNRGKNSYRNPEELYYSGNFYEKQ